MARIAVIGSNSFSGSHFVAHCLEQGHQVLGASRSPEAAPELLAYRWGAPLQDFQFLRSDLNHDLPVLLEALQRFAPEYVVNFAAQGMVGPSWQSPRDWFATNTLAMVDLHEGLRRLSGLKSFVHASTPEVYGNTGAAVREDAPYRPSTPYAASKAACDMSLLTLVEHYRFPAVLTRAANVCGPGQALYRIIPRTVWCALTGERLHLEGGGASRRCFLHIQDVCEATWKAACQAEPGSIFHLAGDRMVSIRELVELVCERLGVAFADVAEDAPARPAQDAAYILNWERARDRLGWSPRRGLEQAVDETIGWVRQNMEALRAEPRAYQHRP